MKTRNHLIALGLLFIFSASFSSTFAQDAKKDMADSKAMTKTERHEKMKEKVIKELELNDEQIAKFDEVHASHMKEMEALHEKKEEMHAAHMDDMKEILTEEQWKEFQQMKKAHHGKKACCKKGGKKGCHDDKK